MKYRKLRIAWSVAWGVVAILLCVMWVRSYRLNELVAKLDSNSVATTLGVANGNFYIIRMKLQSFPSFVAGPAKGWTYGNAPTTPQMEPRAFSYEAGSYGFQLHLTLWTFIAAAIGVGAVSWMRFNYSVRTLLIVTTLVAVGLGAIIWALK